MERFEVYFWLAYLYGRREGLLFAEQLLEAETRAATDPQAEVRQRCHRSSRRREGPPSVS